jgi:membrane carboxypeptidase/penicillin-binding protein PbpC
MWKTGTSSLRRDAWAVGHNRRYAIGVWAGRFAGAGNAALIGATAAEPLLAGIFNLQGLRTRQPPPPAASWPVRHPLGPPPGQQAALSITSPEEGAVFIAMGPQAIVHPTASYTEGISWFLDGSFVGYGPLPRLPVRPGQHILYCTDKNGAASTVSFQVRSR